MYTNLFGSKHTQNCNSNITLQVLNWFFLDFLGTTVTWGGVPIIDAVRISLVIGYQLQEDSEKSHGMNSSEGFSITHWNFTVPVSWHLARKQQASKPATLRVNFFLQLGHKCQNISSPLGSERYLQKHLSQQTLISQILLALTKHHL